MIFGLEHIDTFIRQSNTTSDASATDERFPHTGQLPVGQAGCKQILVTGSSMSIHSVHLPTSLPQKTRSLQSRQTATLPAGVEMASAKMPANTHLLNDGQNPMDPRSWARPSPVGHRRTAAYGGLRHESAGVSVCDQTSRFVHFEIHEISSRAFTAGVTTSISYTPAERQLTRCSVDSFGRRFETVAASHFGFFFRATTKLPPEWKAHCAERSANFRAWWMDLIEIFTLNLQAALAAVLVLIRPYARNSVQVALNASRLDSPMTSERASTKANSLPSEGRSWHPETPFSNHTDTTTTL